MSNLITVAFVDSFKSNVIHLSQQRGSRLRALVREEEIVGKRYPFETLAATVARKRTSRHSDTPQIDQTHARRWTSQADYDWADLVDDEDKARLLITPESSYAINGANAMGRAIDDVLIAAATASAASGADGSSSSSYDTTNQQVAVDYVESGSSANSNLTIGKLRKANSIYGVSDVDEELPRVLVVSQSQLDSLLRTTEVTNRDYNIVQALVEGKVSKFMGFNFVRSQRLAVDGSSIRTCISFVAGPESGLGLAVGRDVKVRMSERDDKNYALQVFLSMSLGAVRVEDEKVVTILCDES